MHNLLLRVALWGEPPEAVQQTRLDWESHLADYAQDHSPTQTAIATVHACTAHIWWRITARRGGLSAVPALAIVGAMVLILLYFAAVDPVGSTSYADAHTTVGGALFVVALARRPWQLPYSRMLSTSLLVLGTSGIHSAFVLDIPAPAYHVWMVALILIAIGVTGAGVSSIQTKTPLGAHVHLWWALAAGMALIVTAKLVLARTLGNDASVVALAAIAVIEIAFIPQLVTLWRLGQATLDAPVSTQQHLPSASHPQST